MISVNKYLSCTSILKIFTMCGLDLRVSRTYGGYKPPIHCTPNRVEPVLHVVMCIDTVLFDRYKHDIKKTWGIISETLSRSVPNSISDTMTINGEDCSDRQVIADNFNDCFSTIRESNEKNIRKHNGSHFQDYLTNHTDCHFAFHLINNNDTIRIIKKIKLSKSKGHDGVSTELLKLINNDISNCITLIINQSLTSCIYPDSLSS